MVLLVPHFLVAYKISSGSRCKLVYTLKLPHWRLSLGQLYICSYPNHLAPVLALASTLGKLGAFDQPVPHVFNKLR